MTDLERAYIALTSKVGRYNKSFDYAEGNQPLMYTSERLRELFRSLDAHFNQNWASVVIETSMDRLMMKGWSHEDKNVNDLLSLLYTENQVALEAHDTHKSSLITHEAFIIAWKDEMGTEVYYNDPRMCHVFYESDNPKRKSFAAKWFQDEATGKYHITMYYRDRLEYYEAPPKKDGVPTSAGAFKPSDPPTAPNPYGEIPVFHFVINRRSRTSELTNILTLQDAINKLLSDMMVAAEFGAFKQRYVITNSDTVRLKNAPNEIWQLPPGDGVGQGTQVGEFSETNLSNFLGAIDKLASSIAVISRTPKHYFYGTGSDPSGEALIAMEAPLVAKVELYQESFTVTWKELASFLLKLEGMAVPAKDIQVVWNPAQSVQPMTEATTVKTYKEAGVPLSVALRWVGKTEDEIMEVEEVLKNEKAESAKQSQLLLDAIRLKNAQDNQLIPGEGE